MYDDAAEGADNKAVGLIDDVSRRNTSEDMPDTAGVGKTKIEKDEKVAEDTALVLSTENKVVGLVDDVSNRKISEDTSDTGVGLMRLFEIETDREGKAAEDTVLTLPIEVVDENREADVTKTS